MKTNRETNLNNHYDSDPITSIDVKGGIYKKWKLEIEKICRKYVEQPTHIDGNRMGDTRHVKQILKFGDLGQTAIDVTKLLIPLHIDRTKYETDEQLFNALSKWWINIKNRSPKTITVRIRHARAMVNHSLYPIKCIKFQPEQIINQLLFRQIYEYPEKAKETGSPNYGICQLNNFWKTVNTFAEAFGENISHWGYSPPSQPEPQVKIVPTPRIVNRLIHHRYTWDRYENALIRTLLTVGFHIGTRPEELIILKASNVKIEENYLIINEQKKKFRERQIWIDKPVMKSEQQNSLKNWITIWRPQKITDVSKDILFIQSNGKPFPSEDAFRMYLAPFVKPVWNDFNPK